MKAMVRNNRVTRALVLGAAAIAIGGGGVALAVNASAAEGTWYFVESYPDEDSCKAALTNYQPPAGATEWGCYPADEPSGTTYELQYLA